MIATCMPCRWAGKSIANASVLSYPSYDGMCFPHIHEWKQWNHARNYGMSAKRFREVLAQQGKALSVTTFDEIKQPAHYTGTTLEVMDVVEDWGWAEDFYRGNVLKYLRRAGRKPSSSKLQDYSKAAQYCQRLVELAKKDKP